MAATLIDTLSQLVAVDRDGLEAEYREILKHDRPADADRLAEILGELGLTIDDVKSDRVAIREAARLRGQTKTPEELKALDEAHLAAQAAYYADLRASIAQKVELLDGPVLQETYAYIARTTWNYATPTKNGNCLEEMEEGARPVVAADLLRFNARNADTDTRRWIVNLAERHPRVAELIHG